MLLQVLQGQHRLLLAFGLLSTTTPSNDQGQVPSQTAPPLGTHELLLCHHLCLNVKADVKSAVIVRPPFQC
ncbi:hypothetical protein CROQUDRAFT_468677 [Cronartium quercuum f. sp. fusiforme G11]|uniref:Secreted protein n=1 Tax=Cronartium quercuum f. sp. fusiforme G11 TaxID=708437 RepID=A0A9P6TCL2_9BASI|nr:hypothetical protein CROQUDRAFT_468677 [Cronartium quercuum f. sp. fusiforme G11]